MRGTAGSMIVLRVSWGEREAGGSGVRRVVGSSPLRSNELIMDNVPPASTDFLYRLLKRVTLHHLQRVYATFVIPSA